MSSQYQKERKICAVCEYWAGTRQVDSYGHQVTVDSQYTKGKCMLQYSGFSQPEANSTCPHWKAWGVLK